MLKIVFDLDLTFANYVKSQIAGTARDTSPFGATDKGQT